MYIHEDNVTCVAQVAKGMKHIPPQLLGFMQELIHKKQIKVQKIKSTNNIANMLTKALLAYTDKRLVHQSRMRSSQETNK